MKKDIIEQLKIDEDVDKIYNEIGKSVKREDVELSIKVFKQVTTKIIEEIIADSKIHNELYKTHEEYKQFVDNLFRETPYNIIKIQTAYDMSQFGKDRAEVAATILTFGIYPIIKIIKYFTKPKKIDRARDYINNVEPILTAYNLSVNNGENFTVLLFTQYALIEYELMKIIDLMKEKI